MNSSKYFQKLFGAILLTGLISVLGSPIGAQANVGDSTVIPVGNSPYSVALLPDGTKAFIANGGDNTVSVLNVSTGAIIGTLPTGTFPGQIVAAPDGNRVYVTNRSQGTFTVIDAQTLQIVTGADYPLVSPNGSALSMIVSPDSANLIIADYIMGSMTNLNLGNLSFTNSVHVSSLPGNIILNPSGTKAFISSVTSDDVAVVSIPGNSSLARITGLVNPGGMATSPSGDKLYVLNSGANTIGVFSSTTYSLLQTINTGLVPSSIAVTADGLFGYVTNSGSDTIWKINLSTGAQEGSFPTGSSPQSIQLSANQDKLLFVNAGSNTVEIISLVDSPPSPTPVQPELPNTGFKIPYEGLSLAIVSLAVGLVVIRMRRISK